MTSWTDLNGRGCRFDLAPGRSPALVMIHELGGSLNSYDGLCRELSTDRAVLRYDMRGAGMSEKVRGALDVDDLCDDLAVLISACELEKPAIVLGAAVGGAIAVRFAARRPELCAELILLGPALGVPAERKEAALGIADALDRDGMRAIADAVLPKAFPDELWSSAEARRTALARWLGADPHGYAAAYRMLAGLDLEGDLAAIRCPTLVLAGRLDPFGPPDLVQSKIQSIPKADFAEVSAGHFMAVQSPEIVAAAIRPSLA